MPNSRAIRYGELRAQVADKWILDDLNHLLPQLSSSAPELTQERLEKVLTSGTRIFAASIDGHIVGVVLLCSVEILVGQKYWIEDVVVDEAHRRQGISSQLMNMAEKASRDSGAKSVNLTSNPDRGGAREMYTRRGYELRDTGVFRLTF